MPAIRYLRSISALMQLGRLHFLLGGVVLHLLGVVMALYTGAALDIAAFIFGQLAITSTQLMTHYANDYFDLEADQKNRTPTNWSGGSRVLVESKLPHRAALITALLMASTALIANLILSIAVRPGITTFLLLLLAQFLAWTYSAPPLRLHSRGLGEITTTVVVTVLTPLTGFYLQEGTITLLPVLAVVPLCCFQFAMMLSIEFPDAEGDQQVNKRTLVVWYGARWAARAYILLLLVAYLILPLLGYLGLPALVIAALSALAPLAGWQIWRILRGDWQQAERWNRLAFYTIVLLMASSAAELAAFILLLGL